MDTEKDIDRERRTCTCIQSMNTEIIILYSYILIYTYIDPKFQTKLMQTDLQTHGQLQRQRIERSVKLTTMCQLSFDLAGEGG